MENKLESLENRIIELYDNFYTESDIYKKLKNRLQKEFSSDLKKCRNFVSSVVLKHIKTLDKKTLENIKEHQRELKEKNRKNNELIKKKINYNEQEEMLKEKVKQLYLCGYLDVDIIKKLNKELRDYFTQDEYAIEIFVRSNCSKVRLELTKEEKLNLNEKRKKIAELLKQQEKIKIVEKIKNRFVTSKGTTPMEKLVQAIKFQAQMDGEKYEKYRRYLKEVDIDFFNECLNNSLLTEEEKVELIETVIEKNIPYTIAYQINGFYQALKYVKENKPNLYNKYLKIKQENRINSRLR